MGKRHPINIVWMILHFKVYANGIGTPYMYTGVHPYLERYRGLGTAHTMINT